MKYFTIIFIGFLFLSFSSCSTKEEEIRSRGFLKAFDQIYDMDYAVADYVSESYWGHDVNFVRIQNRPFTSTENIPTWNYALHLNLLSTLTSKEDFSGSYPLKSFGELKDDGELEGGDLSYLTGAVLFLNMKYEDGIWESGERLFEWTDGHVEISKEGDVYLIQFLLRNKETTYKGEYKGSLPIEKAP